MASKEQYLDLGDLDDLPYLPSLERIRRRKPDWDEEETRIYSPRLSSRRRTGIPSSPTSKPQPEWPEFRRFVDNLNEPIQKPILQMFMVNNGPMAVARGIKKELELVRSDNNVPSEITSRILVDAYGTTFERLACYWLKITTEEPRKVLDVGSTQLLAREITRNLGIYTMPDGFIINDHDNTPLLEAACEYKTNPTGAGTRERLNRQLTELIDFFTHLNGKILHARERDKFSLDRRSHWAVREIRIAAHPSVILVIPQDRVYEPPNEFVEVRQAPFTSVQLSKIVHTLLDDINRMGFIVQELALFEERKFLGHHL